MCDFLLVFRILEDSQVQWLMLVIPDTREIGIRKIKI
jgi:hypothetical protein